jgi:16S rRNA G1207 methylase RsmC
MGNVARLKVDQEIVFLYVEDKDLESFKEHINTRSETLMRTIKNNPVVFSLDESEIDLETEIILCDITDENNVDFGDGAGYETDNQGQIVLYTGVYRWDCIKDE